MKLAKNSRSLPLLTVFFLLFYVLLPFFAVYQLPSQAEGEKLAALFGGKIILCTAEGFQLVNIEDLGGEDAPQPHPDFQCAICFVAAHSQSLKPASPAALAAPQFTALSLHFTEQATPDLTQRWQTFLTRAPPLSFIA